MSFSAELFDNLQPSSDRTDKKDESLLSVSTSAMNSSNEITAHRRPGRPKTGKMERVMCYFPKELLEDMNHFSEKEMISRNAFIITSILKHVKELKKEEKKDLL
ncbi:hypothetical protein [Succinivibrio dextrinosolvens]|jgi:hypothetical protein|uniref:Uncharacterized protein n=1 Tax=Succinivibrio dextrinosolvens DSM 3072 TaxID=1123324 RepID=A0A1T4VTW0_9GAMM|nr:hypothetical protein [Succinivibrio dextrinosolvens]SKA67941.1 hypothetical protein SAMN02745213_01995 [Succinivibrio dextrinosolvens DSM 3072]